MQQAGGCHAAVIFFKIYLGTFADAELANGLTVVAMELIESKSCSAGPADFFDLDFAKAEAVDAHYGGFHMRIFRTGIVRSVVLNIRVVKGASVSGLGYQGIPSTWRIMATRLRENPRLQGLAADRIPRSPSQGCTLAAGTGTDQSLSARPLRRTFFGVGIFSPGQSRSA